MDGSADASTLTTEEQGYYESAQRYLDAEAAGQKADSADYSQYVSRIVAMDRMIAEPANFLTPCLLRDHGLHVHPLGVSGKA